MMAGMKLTVTLNDGTLAGRSYELESGFLTVGRGENCSIRFDPMSERIASKQHAFIEAKVDGYYITDNKSTNGTLVNGNLITDVTKLNQGDTIQFGRNGVTARTQIDDGRPSIARAQSVSTKEGFKEAQVVRFNEIANEAPVSVQQSIANLGLGRMEPKPPPSNKGLYIGLAIAGLLMIPLILVVIGIMFLSLGPVPAVIASVIAFTPAAFYILPLMGLDRYDPEPFWLLVMAFSWGALVAVIVSFVVNTVFGSVVYLGTGSPGLAQFVSAVISAPVIEEGSKGVGLLILLIFFRRYFDDILDGIVYGGVIALGFATVENVLYYGEGLNRAYMPAGSDSN